MRRKTEGAFQMFGRLGRFKKANSLSVVQLRNKFGLQKSFHVFEFKVPPFLLVEHNCTTHAINEGKKPEAQSHCDMFRQSGA